LSTHRLNVKFNSTNGNNSTEFKLYLFGENNAQLVKDGEAFRDSLGDEYKPKVEAEEEYADLFA